MILNIRQAVFPRQNVVQDWTRDIAGRLRKVIFINKELLRVLFGRRYNQPMIRLKCESLVASDHLSPLASAHNGTLDTFSKGSFALDKF